MDSIAVIVLSCLVFNLALVLLIVFLVRKAKNKLRENIITRRQQMLEQGKIISAQENLLKSKQELLKEKDELLKIYRKIP